MTFYNKSWEDPTKYPQFASWVRACDNNKEARCHFCRGNNIVLNNMGQRALLSHLQSKKHINIVRAATITSNITQLQSNPAETKDVIAINRPRTSPVTGRTLPSFIVPNEVTEAELRWLHKLVLGHLSFNSCTQLPLLFKSMFKDSDVAGQLRLGPDKARYVVCFGLAPFYFDTLISKYFPTQFSLSFDEAFNAVSNSAQLDLHITFIDTDTNLVTRRYLDSMFLSHTCAVDLGRNVKACLDRFNWHGNLISVSMDGPNVNWSLMELLKSEMKERDPNGHQLLEIGSCGLHVVHGAYGAGHKSVPWNIAGFLRNSFYLFNKSPARRADFLHVNDIAESEYDHSNHFFPLKFCGHRWLENGVVLSRAISLLPMLLKFENDPPISAMKKASFTMVKQNLQDNLLIAKLEFSKTIANEMEPFLKFYQGDRPLTVFLWDELMDLYKNILARYVKANVLANLNTGSKLVTFNIETDLLPCRNIDVGFGASAALKKLRTQDELKKLEFYKDC